jgi:hypothetical protein
MHEAMGQTMKHAGVAVTITSCTDVFAFAIGSITVSTVIGAIVVGGDGCGAVYCCRSSVQY